MNELQFHLMFYMWTMLVLVIGVCIGIWFGKEVLK